MARVLPSKLPPKVPPAVAKAFRKLKKLPDEFTLWFSIQPASGSPRHPHFLVLWKDLHAFLVHVADTSQELAETALQSDMLAEHQVTVEELGRDEGEVIRGFEKAVHRRMDAELPVSKLVVFPNVEHGTIDAIALQRSDDDVHFLGLQQLGEQSLPDFFVSQAMPALSDPLVVELRACFTPEAVIPGEFNPLARETANTGAALTRSLLDLDQEWIAKNNLYIPPVAEKAVGHGHPGAAQDETVSQLVTGVAGSGKSLVLLYRALLNARLNPDANILVLTHNRPINNELKRRFEALSPRLKNVRWLTFFQWAASMLGDWREQTISPKQTEQVIDSLSKHGLTLSNAYLVEEIGFIKDLNITKKSDYLGLKRTGRGAGLTAGQREQVWRVARDYHQHMVANNLIDWHGVAMRFHSEAVEGNLPLPAYDCILVDEAQFFAKAWFDVVRIALCPGGQLFLAADPTQGFLKRRQSWVSSGIDVRSRTTRLTRAYRNTRAILGFAKSFYDARACEAADDEELNVPDAGQLAQIDCAGDAPEIIYCPSLPDCHVRTANEILGLVENAGGTHAGHHVLVLHAVSGHVGAFQSTLEQLSGGNHKAHDAKGGICPDAAVCQVSTLNAATGLEAPVVFLMGIDSLLEKENDPRLTTDEKMEMVTAHTRQLYMAFTRASAKLVVLTTNRATENFLTSLLV